MRNAEIRKRLEDHEDKCPRYVIRPRKVGNFVKGICSRCGKIVETYRIEKNR